MHAHATTTIINFIIIYIYFIASQSFDPPMHTQTVNSYMTIGDE